jgi:FKBP-type peptidyl-prolyl cis-trans isomerase
MKKVLIFICLFSSVLILHARGIQEDFRQAEEKAQVSYAFGMLFGSNLRATPLEFDYEAFTEGFRAMFEDDTEPQFTEQEAIELVETAMHHAMERVAEENRRREEEFLATNSRRPEVQITPSGLQYEIILETEGAKPASGSVVLVHYVGTFIDGSMFDRSEPGGTYIPLEVVITGWTEGLKMMSQGSIYRLYIPSSLAYGRNGIQNIIPPYSTLIFLVELLDIMNLDDSEEFGS